MTGFAAGDILIGLGGNDVFSSHASWYEAEGGYGDDLYQVSDLRVVIREVARGGNDSVWFSRTGSYTLPDEVENLALHSQLPANGTGNSLDNLIEGNDRVNALAGLDGADTIRAGGGNDTLDGGAGDDFLHGGGGDDRVTTGGGADLVYVSLHFAGTTTVTDFDASADRMQVRGFWDYTLTQQGADTLVTFSPYVKMLLQGVDTTAISAANFDMPPRPDAHTFVGTDGVESLYGWADGDRLYGLDGGDYFGDHDGAWSLFYGGKGSDDFQVDNALDQVIELAGEGHDLIWLYLDGDYVMPDEVEDIYLNQNIARTGVLTANASANLIQGSMGNDTVLGLAGNDTVKGLFGDDSIDGGEGEDRIDGGGGASTLTGGGGADAFFVEWESGNHVITDFTIGEDRVEVWSFSALQSLTQEGADVLALFWTGYDPEYPTTTSILFQNISLEALTSDSIVFFQLGTAAPDTLTGGSGDDDIDAGAGEDTVDGQGGDDDLDGGSGGDSIDGEEGEDDIGGQSGDDDLDGGEDDDSLTGGGGEDTIDGGDGQDTMNGGNGGDVFVFTSIDDSDPELMDRIQRFNPEEDTIDLSAIDANGDAGDGDGDQAFVFADNVQFNHVAGEALIEYDIDHDRTFLMLDVDGDAVTDFTLLLKGEVNEWQDCWVL